MEKIRKEIKDFKKNKALLLMVLPGTIWLVIFSYIPMIGTIIAFKDFRISGNGFFDSILTSEWVGLENFKFLFSTSDAWVITRNTVAYNLTGLILGLVMSVLVAIIMSELTQKYLVKIYQTGMLFPYFLSWVVISYFVYAFLSSDKGMINGVLQAFGQDPISWYSEPKFWPVIIIFLGVWKSLGYNSIIYYASIMGIDRSYYEAAMIDGASKFKQITKVTIPLLMPLVSIMLILSIGSIIRSDFGLFYQVTRNSGALNDVTNVLDTYIYRGLTNNGDLGMTTAAGLYQSVVGFVLVILTNLFARRIDKDSALF
ncbi:sugar ABC transporter permease [Carnobacterium sp.]|uniref:ABC transporter permease n=1 Tax=Carnobacterium sp. TaxID=48221 RepID=UPI0028B09281|nr:sugar ABC transporter permease [Carnobacterium sp.]